MCRLPVICTTLAGMLSLRGRCATFDASGSGYCRGEGYGAAVLRRALLDVGSEPWVQAFLSGSRMNQDAGRRLHIV